MQLTIFHSRTFWVLTAAKTNMFAEFCSSTLSLAAFLLAASHKQTIVAEATKTGGEPNKR